MKRSLDVAILVAVLAGFLLLNALLLGRAAKVAQRTEIVPVPSTYRTTPSGAKALYTLLARLGLRVGRLVTRATAIPADATVIVMLEPQTTITATEALELRRWVDRGGTLILASEGPQGENAPTRHLPEEFFLRDPVAGAERLARIRAELDRRGGGEPYREDNRLVWRTNRTGRYLAGVRSLELGLDASRAPSPEALTTALARFSDGRRDWPVAGDDPFWLCTMTAIGAGQVFCLPTAALFANGQLARGDNALFAVNLIASHAGDGRVLFDEYHLGNVGAESLWAIVSRPPARWVTLQVLLALALLGWRSAVRFGPVRDEDPTPPRRPAVEYVFALAGLYRRAGAHREIARLWLEDARRRLRRAAGLGPDATDERIAARLAARLGRRPDEVTERLRRLADASEQGCGDRELVALARELDALLRTLPADGG